MGHLPSPETIRQKETHTLDGQSAMWDAALGLLALLVGGFLLYRTVQSLGQASVFALQCFLVISMVTVAAVIVLRVGVEPLITKQAAPCHCPPSSPSSPAKTAPLAVHAGQTIRTGLEQVAAWLSSWTSAPGPALEHAHSASSSTVDRDL